MTVETLYVNSDTETRVPPWSKSPLLGSPWLDAGDTSYIFTRTVNAKDGDFGFPLSAGSGTINSVILRFRARLSNAASNNSANVYVYDGTNWLLATLVLAPVTAFFADYDIPVSKILNSWAKINACLMYLAFNMLDNFFLYVSACSRIVDYSAVAAVQNLGDGSSWVTY